MSKLKPRYWGNIIYESAIGLYRDEKEAKEESWMEENFFPLYDEDAVNKLEAKNIELEKAYRAWKSKCLTWNSKHDALEKKLQEADRKYTEDITFMDKKLAVAEHLLEGVRHLEIMDFENPLNYQTSIRNSIASYKIKAK